MQRARFGWTRWLALTVAVLVASGSSVFAAKDVFIRSKPHVNVGTVDDVQMEIRVHVEAALFGDGKATGAMQFAVSDGEKFFYRVVSATAEIGDDEVIGLRLVVERVGDGQETGEPGVITVRRSTAVEDCLIYDIVGPNIQVEAEGTIELRDPARD